MPRFSQAFISYKAFCVSEVSINVPVGLLIYFADDNETFIIGKQTCVNRNSYKSLKGAIGRLIRPATTEEISAGEVNAEGHNPTKSVLVAPAPVEKSRPVVAEEDRRGGQEPIQLNKTEVIEEKPISSVNPNMPVQENKRTAISVASGEILSKAQENIKEQNKTRPIVPVDATAAKVHSQVEKPANITFTSDHDPAKQIPAAVAPGGNTMDATKAANGEVVFKVDRSGHGPAGADIAPVNPAELANQVIPVVKPTLVATVKVSSSGDSAPMNFSTVGDGEATDVSSPPISLVSAWQSPAVDESSTPKNKGGRPRKDDAAPKTKVKGKGKSKAAKEAVSE